MKQEAWVLDGSAALAWVLPDENSDTAEQFLSLIDNPYQVWVPALFWYEIANALTMAERRRRISGAQKSRFHNLFLQLPLRTDAFIQGTAFLQYSASAVEHTLSAYDASYLELACRRNLGLISFDAKLREAALSAGVLLWSRGQTES